MPVWAEVKLSDLALGSRLDPEFYRPEFLLRGKELSCLPRHTLGNVAYVTDGEHGSVPYVEKGVRYLTAENIQKGYVDLSNIRYVEEWVNKRNARAAVSTGDILISIKGTLGQVAVAEEWLPPANMNRDVAIVKIHSLNIQSEYLAAFLLSRFGQFQALREGSGGVQQMITLGRLRTIQVPLLCKEDQESVAALWRRGSSLREQAKSLYASAHGVLESELGLDMIDLSTQLGCESRISEILLARRWDGEFFRPKYQRVMEAVLKAKKVRVEKFIPIGGLFAYLTNGHTPLRHNLGIGEIPFLTAEHISDFRVDFGTDKRILQRHHETELARTALRDGDILITIKGKVGNCAVVRDCPPTANINQDVALIRLRDGVHPYFLAAWFNSLMGKQLVEQRSTGGINPFLGLGNFRGMPFPMILPRDHERIGDTVQQVVGKAYEAERESARLLEEAKRQVEELIESDAMKRAQGGPLSVTYS